MNSNRFFRILFFVTILTIVLLFNFLVSIYRVKGNSMSEYFKEGRYVFCMKNNYFSTFDYGDLVVFNIRNGNGENQLLVKQIVGIPGETVQEIRNDDCHMILILNKNKCIRTITLNKGSNCITNLTDQNTKTVEYHLDNDYFVLGSNYAKSIDSRDFGPIMQTSIIATILFSI
ncbi:MAG TPA: signal peptidase I [Flavilitoribacter sp.]|nr:signal peptidase I [Flavilitoribacter sp.]